MSAKEQKKNVAFWSEHIEEVLSYLHTQKEGLSAEEARVRLKEYGANAIEQRRRVTKLNIFFGQFKSPLIFILLAAGAVTLVLGDWKDSLFIFLAVGVNAVLGFYQENKAEEALSRLQSYLQERVRVVRGGKEKEIDVTEVVPGDVLRLSLGNRVPADARIIAENDVMIDEAVLTGEALPVKKYTKPVSIAAGVSERSNVVFGGTLVVQGTCIAVVFATGNGTEFGKIATLVAESDREETPLQKSLKRFAWVVAQVLFGIIAVIVIAGVISGNSVLDMFLIGVAMAVGAIPEGLPIALTVILAIGVERLAKRNGVVRKLVAAEALGSTTTILTDKTGTLTQAKMSLASVLGVDELLKEGSGTPRELKRLSKTQKDIITAGLINGDVAIENEQDSPEEWVIDGRALEVSLTREAARMGILLTDIQHKIESEEVVPFNSKDKFSVSKVIKNSHTPSFVKGKKGDGWYVFFGAPEILLDRSTLKKDDYVAVRASIDAMAADGQRVLGLAVKKVSSSDHPSKSEFGKLEFLGTIGFFDPLREDVQASIKRVQEWGVKVVIVTGDHKGTAMAVARELGWEVDESTVLDGAQLKGISDEELSSQLERINVFARVTPEYKMRIVGLYQAKGEVVAMTGDGVNDAPSLKKADIGVALGAGTDVSKEVADLVLLDNNFKTITVAIDEGRKIMMNVRKVVTYLLSDSLNEVFLIGGSLLFGFPLALNALQILWVNFFSDSFPSIAYAFEDTIDGSRKHPQRKVIFDGEVKALIVGIGIFSSTLLFGLYAVLLGQGVEESVARTVVFATFGLYTLFLSFSLRSLSRPLFSYNPFSNRFLVLGVLFGVGMMVVGIYLPFLQGVLGTAGLSAVWWLLIIGFSALNIAAVELVKWVFSLRNTN
jgi:Ca2+-transporting ATPase